MQHIILHWYNIHFESCKTNTVQYNFEIHETIQLLKQYIHFFKTHSEKAATLQHVSVFVWLEIQYVCVKYAQVFSRPLVSATISTTLPEKPPKTG